jgi:hypothetical protein
MLRGERLPDEPEAVDPKLERVPGEIADEDYGKRDYDGGGTKKENVPDAMPGYALPFRDVSHNRRGVVWFCFEMVA